MSLNAEDRFAIREMRRANQRMPYREIAKLFGVTISAVERTLNDKYLSRPEAEPKPVFSSPVKPSGSFIRDIPKERLMAGNGRCARPIP